LNFNSQEILLFCTPGYTTLVAIKTTDMKEKFLLSILAIVFLFAGLIDGCKKDSLNKSLGIETSFTEEFQDVYNLEKAGWVIKDNSAPLATWVQAGGGGKGGLAPFPAYSFTASPDEYISAYPTYASAASNVSSWLITPVLSIRNGDKISFYSRADTGSLYQDRMQVLMNASTSADVGSNPQSVGSFTTVLLDINSAQAPGGYPVDWTKHEYTFSGISGKVEGRIGFRYFVPNTAIPRGIGIDLFKFEK
jgi:hypothetical protein